MAYIDHYSKSCAYLNKLAQFLRLLLLHLSRVATHMRTHTLMHALQHTHTHTRTHTYTPMYTHTHMHVCTNTYTHIHTCIRRNFGCLKPLRAFHTLRASPSCIYTSLWAFGARVLSYGRFTSLRSGTSCTTCRCSVTRVCVCV
jgi:hypothetical protein